MAVDRLTGCLAIIVPSQNCVRDAHSVPIDVRPVPWSPRYHFVPLYHGGNCPHRTVKERDGTPEQGFTSSQSAHYFIAKRPLSGRLTRFVAALLTGSSRQRLNGFIGRTPASRRIGRARIFYSAP